MATVTATVADPLPDEEPETGVRPRVGAPALARAVGVQLGGRVAGMVASVLTVAVTTRHLGVDGFGMLTTAVVFVALWTSLTELGVGVVIVRRVTAHADDLARLVGLNVGLSLFYCLPLGALAAVSGLLVYADRPEIHGVLVVVSAGLVLNTVASCFAPMFVATVRFAAVALSDFLCRVATLVATLVVVSMDGGLFWFGAAQLAAPTVLIVVQGIAAYRLLPYRPIFDLRASIALLRESLPQTGVLIIGVLYWRADAVILTLVGTPSQVGAYGIAYTAAFTLSVLSSFFQSSSLAEMSAGFASDQRRYARFVESGMCTMAFLGLPIAVVGGILAEPLITLLGSARFAASAALPFALLAVCVALTFFTGMLSQALFAAHEQVFLLRLNIINLVLNIGLNLVLAPRYGADGAAVALLASEVSGLIVVSWRLRRHGYETPYYFGVNLALPLAAAAAVALALRDQPVLLAAALAGIVYALANLLVGPVRMATVRSLIGTSDGRAVGRSPGRHRR